MVGRDEILRTVPINGILHDREMPVMDGLRMLNRLQQRSSSVSVIVMSADPTRTRMIKANKGGTRDDWFKPVSGEILNIDFFLSAPGWTTLLKKPPLE
jgi:DNA-binding NtrC family response regulator